MTDTDEKVVKPFSTFLIEQRNGALAAELGEALHELVEAVTETSKAGSLTLTIKIKPEGAVLFVSDDVKVKAPAAERTASIFYADEHANLSRKDPRQPLPQVARRAPRPLRRARLLVAGAALVSTMALASCSVATTAAVLHEPDQAVTLEQRIALYNLAVGAIREARANDPRLACIRSHESANVLPTPWWAYNPDGPYYGAYQYLQGTWNNHAQLAGRSDLVGRPPIEPYVAWYDQDEVVAHYLDATGDWSPWGGPC